jgi:hypothetical protein
MGDMYGPLETMAEQGTAKGRRRACRSTHVESDGTTHRCTEQGPHPDVEHHDDELTW